MDTLQQIIDARIIPTIKNVKVEEAPALFAAICSGGMTAALVTYRSNDSCNILRQGARLFPDLLLGAEGISSIEDAQYAIRSGARIIATNGFSREISHICSENTVLYLPFCLTPSELLAHQMLGGKVAGIFSPESFGRISSIDALSVAFPYLPFLPSNIPLDKLALYLAQNSVIACTCPELAEGSFEEIVQKCQRSVEIAMPQ